MRDILRRVLHWLSAGPAVIPAGNLDVEASDHAAYVIAMSDAAAYTIAVSDRTRG